MLVSILVLIGGAVFITQALSTKEKTTQVDWMYKISVDDIWGISVIHQGTLQGYTRHEPHNWVILDGRDSPVHGPKWSGTPLLLSGPRGSRLLSEQIDDPAKYGLDKPQTLVTVVDGNGTPAVDFVLGAVTADGRDWYARVVGSQRLFTVNSDWSEVISSLVTEPPYTPSELTVDLTQMSRISVVHKDRRTDYALKNTKWVIKDGKNSPVSGEKWADATKYLAGPRYTRLLQEELEDPAKYGLDQPQTTVHIMNSGLDPIDFQLGSPTPEGDEWYARLIGTGGLFTVSSKWGEAISKLGSAPPYATGDEPVAVREISTDF